MRRSAIALPIRSCGTKSYAKALPTTELFSKLKTGPMKRLYKYYTPEAVNIAGGVPMDSVFPTKKVSVTLEDGKQIDCTLGDNLMMNYQRGDGTPGLRDWISSHVAEVHNVPANSGSATCMTIGSTDGLAKVLQLVATDVVILDEFAYGTAVAVCNTLDKQPVGVPMDAHGIIPERLEEAILAMRAQNLRVNLLYLVPTGQNPTGHSITETRKREILRICQKMEVIIVEDGRLRCAVLCCPFISYSVLVFSLCVDAYYYLHYGEGPEMPGTRALPTSFYELDLQTAEAVTGAPARSVLRMDSLSKFIAPGMRLGWIAGPEEFIQKYQLLQEMTSQFPGGLTQSVFLRMVQNWADQEAAGGVGLHAHVQHMQRHYRDQRDVMVAALEKYLPPGVAEYDIPTAGMFLWLKLSPGADGRSAASFDVFKHLAACGVIVVPGGDFFVPGVMGTSVDPSIVRLTFAAATPAQITEGIQRMGRALETLPVS